ncbi:MAG TPA: beta-propeller fold lactonase family protein [Solirubrobacter sp.]|nr:beta-propeller fold lactonase family protein [Solirubrobacter sp.]
MRRRGFAAGIALALLAAAPAAAVEPSAFSQLAGASGCLMQIDYEVDHGCSRVGGLAGAQGVTVSPDDRFVYVASGGTLSEGSNGVVYFARDTRTGALTRAGCVTANGGDGRVGTEGSCARGDALLGAAEVALSPDGLTAYVASAVSGGLAWMTRDPQSGALTPAGCVKDFPRADHCREVSLLTGATAVAVAPDGRDVYVASPVTASLHALRRDANGLTRVQCLAETGGDGACDPASGIQDVRDVAVAPDGRAVYVAGGSGAVAAFARDPATGRLTQAGCLLDQAPDTGPCQDAGGIAGAAGVAVSPDGRDVYVAGRDSEAVASFRVQPDGALKETGCLQRVPSDREDGSAPDKRCTPATALWGPGVVVVSADGRTVFAGGQDTITSYRRDPQTGTLEQLGCAEEDQTSEDCLEVRATLGVNALAATADGRNVYVTADAENAVTVLGAAVAVAARATRAGHAGRFRVRLSCPRARTRACAGRVRAGRGAARAYRIRPGRHAHVRLRLEARARRTLARHARVRVTVRATDRALRATKRRVLVQSGA